MTIGVRPAGLDSSDHVQMWTRYLSLLSPVWTRYLSLLSTCVWTRYLSLLSTLSVSEGSRLCHPERSEGSLTRFFTSVQNDTVKIIQNDTVKIIQNDTAKIVQNDTGSFCRVSFCLLCAAEAAPADIYSHALLPLIK